MWGDSRCGHLASVAFVGSFPGALAVADLLRRLHGGPALVSVHCDLRDPSDMRGAENDAPGPALNPGSRWRDRLPKMTAFR